MPDRMKHTTWLQFNELKKMNFNWTELHEEIDRARLVDYVMCENQCK